MKLFNFFLLTFFCFNLTCNAGEKKPLPDSSLYQLHSEWTTDVNTKIKLENLRGKARVLTLFFSNCESSCPVVMTHLKTMESLLTKNWTSQGGIVLVSLDPKRDKKTMGAWTIMPFSLSRMQMGES